MNRYQILVIEKSFLGKQKLQFLEWFRDFRRAIKSLPKSLKKAWKNRAKDSMWDDLSRIAFVTFLFQLVVFSLNIIYRGSASNLPVIIWGFIFLVEIDVSKRCKRKKQETQQ